MSVNFAYLNTFGEKKNRPTIYVGSVMTCAHILILWPSSLSMPPVHVCFGCNKELYSSYIAIGGMVKVEYDIFDSQFFLNVFNRLA